MNTPPPPDPWPPARPTNPKPPVNVPPKPGFLLRGLDASGLLGVLLALGLFAVLAFMACGVALVSVAITAASP